MKVIKLKNKRVAVGKSPDGKFHLNFVRLKTQNETYTNCPHKKVTGKRVVTGMSLTPSAAVALYHLLNEMITTEDMEKFNAELKLKR